MGSTAIRSDPALWEGVKRLVTAGEKGGRKGQWSARGVKGRSRMDKAELRHALGR